MKFVTFIVIKFLSDEDGFQFKMYHIFYCVVNRPFEDFLDITIDSQTTDITHFAVVSHCDATIKALETLQSTGKCL